MRAAYSIAILHTLPICWVFVFLFLQWLYKSPPWKPHAMGSVAVHLLNFCHALCGWCSYISKFMLQQISSFFIKRIKSKSFHSTFRKAAISGVIFLLSAASTSAPACTSNWTTSKWPPFAASHNGVFPFLFRTSMWAPLQKNQKAWSKYWMRILPFKKKPHKIELKDWLLLLALERWWKLEGQHF